MTAASHVSYISIERARRDLRWLLQNQPILKDCAFGDDCWMGAECIQTMRDHYSDQIDTIPDSLLKPATHERRSGRYFEALVVALVEFSPTLDLLAHDLQVRDSKRTLGAFDLLIRDRESQSITHLELAFKQYLHRHGNGQEFDQWLGPRARDRLDIKTHHMMSHQLKLGASSAGKAALHELGIDSYQPRALMAGRLFLPIDTFRRGERPNFPDGCTEKPALGWWCGLEQVNELQNSDHRWRVLPPIYAVAPVNADDCSVLSEPDWQKVRRQVHEGVPCLVSEVSNQQEISRGWIVRT